MILAWRRAALAIEDYRRVSGYENPNEALGFVPVLDGEVAIYDTAAAGGIILQRYYQKDWAENLMLSLQVDDLDAWWAHIDGLDLPGRFGVRPPAPPKLWPWGLREVHVIDPAGVLWHFVQNRAIGRPA